MFPLLRFYPILKRARWGGRRLATALHKRVGVEPDYSESWELCDVDENQSILMNSSGAQVTLRQLVRESPLEIFGTGVHAEDHFPLLIKFLDANDRLSLQVHPNDAQAALSQPGSRGKTEAWYILDAAPDAVVYAGLKPGTTLEALRHALANGTVQQALRTIPVKRGDCLLIPAGTVHAVGAGVLLLEVQQASDITYRLHDWGWVDAEGKPRELHLTEAFACIDPDLEPVLLKAREIVRMRTISEEPLVNCDYFQMQRLSVSGSASLENRSMRIWSVIGGRGEVCAGEVMEVVQTGDTVLIPAATTEFEVTGEDLELIETRLGAATSVK